MSDADSTQPVTDNERSANRWAFEDVLELLVEQFSPDDSSERHARLNVELPKGTQPVMVYRGTSNLEASREVVNIASPLLDVNETKAYDIAVQMDSMPLGALRRLGGILHIHEVLAFGEFTSDSLLACIRLIAAQAASIRSTYAQTDTASDEGEQ